jgi:ABC-2 type transport system permease protein
MRHIRRPWSIRRTFAVSISPDSYHRRPRCHLFRVLLKKYFHESIALWLALAAVLFVFPWVRIWTVSQFELSGFAPLIEQFRAFEKFSPVPLEQFLTYHGIIGLTFDEPVLLLCVLVWSIARGTDVVSGELGRGTMEMLLAQPITRGQLMRAHATITILGLVLLCGLVYAGLTMGIRTNSTPMQSASNWTIPWLNWNVVNPMVEPEKRMVPLSELVSPSNYVASTLNLFGLGFALLGISVMVSSFDQYRWRTIGVVIGIYVLQLLLFILSKSAPSFAALKPFTFLAAYQPDWMVRTIHNDPSTAWRFWMGESANSPQEILGPMGYTSVLMLLGCAAYAIGRIQFERRDLPAPQ